MKNLSWTVLVFALLTAFACTKEENQDEIDRNIILQYLEDNNLTAEEHLVGMYYIIHEPGTGDEGPKVTSEVTVRYTGFTTDGAIFDQTQGNDTVTFPLGNLIAGWQIGIPLLKKGGEITLFLPSRLAYGSGGHPLARQVLIFDIELVDY